MTIVLKCAHCQPSLSLEDFKRWLKQFDRNGDGLISKRELRAAMRSASVRLSWFKSEEAMREADANGDGLLDDEEMENLVAFAQNRLGMKIVA
ncbi:Calmodulin [Nymphaea thermarum]|nr:Calmodulin [Nymphaea thermarum]